MEDYQGSTAISTGGKSTEGAGQGDDGGGGTGGGAGGGEAPAREQLAGSIMGPSGVAIDLGSDTKKMSSGQRQHLIQEINGMPEYREKKGPHAERVQKFMEYLFQDEYPQVVEESQRGLTEILLEQGSEESRKQFGEDLPNSQEELENYVYHRQQDKIVKDYGLKVGDINIAISNIGKARKVVRSFLSEKDLDFIEDSGLGDDPELFTLLGQLHDKLAKTKGSKFFESKKRR